MAAAQKKASPPPPPPKKKKPSKAKKPPKAAPVSAPPPPPKKKPSKAKKPPKAAPVSVSKAKKVDLDGPRPMSQFDYDFCQAFVQTQKQAEAYRSVRPDAKDPHVAAHRMMQRTEIREHIRAIYAEISKERDRAVQVSARASLLSLEVADDRLMELAMQRRKTRGEMLSKDLKTPLIKGIVTVVGQEGEPPSTFVTGDILESLEGPAPIEDCDLLKTIDLIYKRKGGIIKAEKPMDATNLNVMLYKPQWFGRARTIDGEV